MKHLLGGTLTFLVGLSVAQAEDKPATPAEQFKALAKEFNTAARGLWEAKTDDERAQAAARGVKSAPRFLDLAEKYPNDPVALDALIQVVMQVNWVENNTQHPGFGKDNPRRPSRSCSATTSRATSSTRPPGEPSTASARNARRCCAR